MEETGRKAAVPAADAEGPAVETKQQQKERQRRHKVDCAGKQESGAPQLTEQENLHTFMPGFEVRRLQMLRTGAGE